MFVGGGDFGDGPYEWVVMEQTCGVFGAGGCGRTGRFRLFVLHSQFTNLQITRTMTARNRHKKTTLIPPTKAVGKPPRSFGSMESKK